MSTERDWDVYFIRIAKEVSKHSHCLSRKIGAVLVRDKNVVSTGYNGPPSGVKHCNERDFEFYEKLDQTHIENYLPDDDICPRRQLGYKSGEGLHLCQAGHAERNAIIQAAKHGIPTKGASLYCYCPLPCKDCVIECINAGLAEIVCLKGNDYDKYSRVLINESGVKLRELDEKILSEL